MPTPGSGKRLAIDVGTVRIGIAKCDQDQILATPVETVPANKDSISKIIDIARETGAELIYVGNPVTLRNSDTKSTLTAQDFAKKLVEAADIMVRLLDERLTTVSAKSALQSAGRSEKSGRSVIDQVAAVLLLDHALAIEKTTGKLAGNSIPN